jgi:membrane protein YqaA with SNARE-associated domain
MELSPWMVEFIGNYGFTALLLVSFIAATILPFSSEAALTIGILSGIPILGAVVACSIGNCAACSFNYGLGALFSTPAKIQKSKSGKKAYQWVKKYGIWSLLLTWLPVIGDPITIAAGIFRMKLIAFLPIVFSLRILRYIVIAYFLK